MSTHSPTGASGMYRWAACPGSVALCSTIPDRPSSVHAERGARAHEAAADWLTSGVPPVFDDPEDFRAVAEYVSICDRYYTVEHQNLGAIRGVEHRFKMDEDTYGTSDYWVYWPWLKHLIILDYKHGEGIFVDVKDNAQLLYYASGVVNSQPWGRDVKTIELGIVQPRCMTNAGEESLRTWNIDRTKLFEFEVTLAKAIAATKKPDAPLVPGEHCHPFCPALAVCPAIERQRDIALQSDFAGVVTSQAKVYDVRTLAAALNMRDALKGYLKALDEFAYREMNAGVRVPGYKLVQKRSQRKYKDPVLLENTLKAAGLGGVMYTKPELLSPAQLEKAIPSHKALIAEHCISESSGLTVEPESDKRPAVVIDAAHDFAVVSLESLGL